MSRASEMTLLIILIQASIGFVDATGVFSQHYLSVPENNASYTISDLKEYTAVQEPSVFDELLIAAHWMVEAFIIGIKILLAVVFVLPTLILTFHVPTILATFIQVGVYYIYAVFYAQYKSGKAWGLIREV